MNFSCEELTLVIVYKNNNTLISFLIACSGNHFIGQWRDLWSINRISCLFGVLLQGHMFFNLRTYSVWFFGTHFHKVYFLLSSFIILGTEKSCTWESGGQAVTFSHPHLSPHIYVHIHTHTHKSEIIRPVIQVWLFL